MSGLFWNCDNLRGTQDFRLAEKKRCNCQITYSMGVDCPAQIHAQNNWDSNVDEFDNNRKRSLSERQENLRVKISSSCCSTVMLKFMLQAILRQEKERHLGRCRVYRDVRL
jgi:hypothetical protein